MTAFDEYGSLARGDLVYNENLSIIDKELFILHFKNEHSFPCLFKISASSSENFRLLTSRNISFRLAFNEFLNINSASEKILRIYKNKSIEVHVNFKKCEIGEFFDGTLCRPCSPDFYSFKEGFAELSSCTLCAGLNFYCYGGFNHTPKPGYWRAFENSINFIKCPNKIGKI
jgi:hypothetical protein